MKKISVTLLLFLLFSIVNAQVTQKAVVVNKFSNYKVGDTAILYGYTKNVDVSSDFLIKQNDDNGFKRVSVSKFNVVGKQLGFWDYLWFYNRANDVLTKGWDTELRNDLLLDCREFIQNLQKNKLLFDDDYLQDYLSQLIHKICPTKLNKQRNDHLTVYVMKSNEPQSFSFDNGAIVISTALLAEAKNEVDLVKILSKEITNIVLEHNLLNLKQQIRAQRAAKFWTGFAAVVSTAAAINSAAKGNNNFTFGDAMAVTLATDIISTSVLERVGANYSAEQVNTSIYYAGLFNTKEYDKMDHKTPDEYNRIISNVISYTAWQNFYALNYNEAIDFINRLENAGVANEEDYLLKARIYRTLYNTDESNYEALRCIKTAKSIGLTKLVDLSKEEGLLYLRIGDKAKAKTAFDEYRVGLEELQSKGDDNSSEIRWAKEVMFKNNL